MYFHSLYDQGFARIATVTLPVHLANPDANATEIIEATRQCSDNGAAITLFPELCVTGYALDDLFLSAPLLDRAEAALATIAQASRDLLPLIVVGAPLRHDGRLFNCAVAIHRGTIVAVTPKQHLPNYREFYEKRYFSTPSATTTPTITVAGQRVPFGSMILGATDIPGLNVGIEICEDMWMPFSPASALALSGATVILNLSASPITVGRGEDRRLHARSASARLCAAYAYAAAGQGESTTDLAWDGHTMIYEAGDLLAEGPRFAAGTQITYADVDLDRLVAERHQQNSFADNADHLAASANGHLPFTCPMSVSFTVNPPRTDLGLLRPHDRFPFVPDDPERLAHDCYEAYNIQVAGLIGRLKAIGNPKVVIGVSGGLDSTHALIVAAQAMDRLGRPRTDILGYTMPGFATSDHTKSKAWELGRRLGISFAEIDIRPAAKQMLADMGHPYADGAAHYDVTFENVQAGLRTDYLFRLANHHGGIVLGTGDLSELALGWCTYGVGDQMSHYAVNTGVPKTMIQHLIRWVAASGQFDQAVAEVLESVLAQEISPELVPAGPDGQMQSTQDRIGPYNLQDFTLFHVLRRGSRPSKIAFLAYHAWRDASSGAWPASFPEHEKCAYSLAEIVKWEELFIRRFFSQQFKRTALPNGPKVMAGGSLSPRGDWRMPSDASPAAWLAELHSALAGVPGSGIDQAH
ncbi:NAD(+) synthase [Schaalia suimastitidis]|uniref:NAD(+) synthase n=1 Tax=Schaalia suimastitidis TaxID=121163 RepID=UPI00041A0E65|nr:NAD(+) synthase [Schaalia suimastitidis]